MSPRRPLAKTYPYFEFKKNLSQTLSNQIKIFMMRRACRELMEDGCQYAGRYA